MFREGFLPHALIQLLFLTSLLVVHVPAGYATPISMVQTVNDLWSSLAMRAAKETIAAVLVGRQHHLGLEVDGVTYDLLLGNEQEAVQEARKRATAAAATAAAAGAAAAAAASAASVADGVVPAAQALPAAVPREPTASTSTSTSADAVDKPSTSAAAVPSVVSGSQEVALLQLFNGPRSSRSLELPETTLAGPLELLLPVPEPVSIYSPLAADVGGPVRRVVIDTGVTVRVAGLRRVSLRRPLDLPRLPGQYLAEVYAQVATGEAEEGFGSAPGIVYLAEQIRKSAESAANSSSHSGREAGARGKQGAPAVLSLEVETVAPGALTLTSAPELPPPYAAAAAPRLKVRRLAGGSVELSLRQGQLTPADTFNPAAVSRVWAWPLPHTDSSSWLPYETLLRSILASHPFNVDKVIRRGIGLRLTKSSIQGTHLIAFDMEVRARSPRPPELEGAPYEWNEMPLEIWEAVVQVQPQGQTHTQAAAAEGGSTTTTSAAAGEGFRFVPLHAKRKQTFQNTLTMSRSAMILALTGGVNATVGGPDGDGYDQVELGLAANAP
ncbi:hypothetical protein VOLCADRAFT_90713 [Volvox carteri f. nagariensis]|uniref:Uncharacterized protein n=1 Tax=Volvox carteri f. nagariensis TaxID=3068 RepID=D8TVI9_VOLCA|nr:uncharacterized protein VOLCADRAFT_90713 [Volvox carteri f. nagariensis]EFJ48466.1 hypothetical protein VOLCADRAFT_90713 [Volvox carteri f. nagariensis]|eukprot:XP_002950265.1 hypothetical protein VOLCADRAFT_90713 [Volvox carteri f. nagariensis]